MPNRRILVIIALTLLVHLSAADDGFRMVTLGSDLSTSSSVEIAPGVVLDAFHWRMMDFRGYSHTPRVLLRQGTAVQVGWGRLSALNGERIDDLAELEPGWHEDEAMGSAGRGRSIIPFAGTIWFATAGDRHFLIQALEGDGEHERLAWRAVTGGGRDQTLHDLADLPGAPDNVATAQAWARVAFASLYQGVSGLSGPMPRKRGPWLLARMTGPLTDLSPDFMHLIIAHGAADMVAPLLKRGFAISADDARVALDDRNLSVDMVEALAGAGVSLPTRLWTYVHILRTVPVAQLDGEVPALRDLLAWNVQRDDACAALVAARGERLAGILTAQGVPDPGPGLSVIAAIWSRRADLVAARAGVDADGTGVDADQGIDAVWTRSHDPIVTSFRAGSPECLAAVLRHPPRNGPPALDWPDLSDDPVIRRRMLGMLHVSVFAWRPQFMLTEFIRAYRVDLDQLHDYATRSSLAPYAAKTVPEIKTRTAHDAALIHDCLSTGGNLPTLADRAMVVAACASLPATGCNTVDDCLRGDLAALGADVRPVYDADHPDPAEVCLHLGTADMVFAWHDRIRAYLQNHQPSVLTALETGDPDVARISCALVAQFQPRPCDDDLRQATFRCIQERQPRKLEVLLAAFPMARAQVDYDLCRAILQHDDDLDGRSRASWKRIIKGRLANTP